MQIYIESSDRHREFAFTDEVHVGLIIFIIFFIIITILIFVFDLLLVLDGFIFLLQVFLIGAREETLELDDKLSDTLICFLDELKADFLRRPRPRIEFFLLVGQVCVLNLLENCVPVGELLERLLRDFALVDGRHLSHELL